jgi:hypothetical protein
MICVPHCLDTVRESLTRLSLSLTGSDASIEALLDIDFTRDIKPEDLHISHVGATIARILPPDLKKLAIDFSYDRSGGGSDLVKHLVAMLHRSAWQPRLKVCAYRIWRWATLWQTMRMARR